MSPVFGWDRDDLEVHGPRGATSTQTDTKPEYGLFALVSHPNLTASDFLFFSRVNKTDVLGNFFFANYYVNSETKLTWNVGAGHLYHRILQTTLNYNYQDSQGVDENFQTLRGRVDVFLSRHWGFVARVDYMEHMSTRDTSLLFGPTCVF